MAAALVVLHRTGSELVATQPLATVNVFGDAVNRNVWFTDRAEIWSWSLPPYIAPLLRGLWENWKPADRFGRMLEHILVTVAVSGLAAFMTFFAAWGSIWCITASFILLIMDGHLVAAVIEQRSGRREVVAHPFALTGGVQKAY